MSFCAVPSKVVAPTQAARPARAMAVRCEAVRPVDRVKQVGAAILSTAVIATASPVFALGNPDEGQLVFDGNCAACHAGGQNNVIPEKTLEKASIEKYLEGGYNEAAILKQVRNGKGAMPAWEGRLDDEDIVDVVAYVLQQSAAGW